MTIKIVEVNYGIASRYDGLIEINRKLKDPLRSKILRHELAHKEGKYTLEDYKVDFQSKDPFFFEALKFALKNPEALINYAPIMYSFYREVWTYNITGFIIFSIYGFFSSLVLSLVLPVSFLLTSLYVINFIVICNLLLLIYTYFYQIYCSKTLILKDEV